MFEARIGRRCQLSLKSKILKMRQISLPIHLQSFGLTVLYILAVFADNSLAKVQSFGEVIVGNFFVYPINSADIPFFAQLSEKGSSRKCADEDEGFRIVWLLKENDQMHTPMEIFVRCRRFTSLLEKIRTITHYSTHFSAVSGRNFSSNSEQMCADRFGKATVSSKATGGCFFHRMVIRIIYSNGTLHKGSHLFYQSDVLKLRAAYDAINAKALHVPIQMAESLGVGCFTLSENNQSRTLPDTCASFRTISKDAHATIALYRLHCCCATPSKCRHAQQSRSDIPCPYTRQDYEVGQYVWGVNFASAHHGSSADANVPVERIHFSENCTSVISLRRMSGPPPSGGDISAGGGERVVMRVDYREQFCPRDSATCGVIYQHPSIARSPPRLTAVSPTRYFCCRHNPIANMASDYAIFAITQFFLFQNYTVVGNRTETLNVNFSPHVDQCAFFYAKRADGWKYCFFYYDGVDGIPINFVHGYNGYLDLKREPVELWRNFTDDDATVTIRLFAQYDACVHVGACPPEDATRTADAPNNCRTIRRRLLACFCRPMESERRPARTCDDRLLFNLRARQESGSAITHIYPYCRTSDANRALHDVYYCFDLYDFAADTINSSYYAITRDMYHREYAQCHDNDERCVLGPNIFFCCFPAAYTYFGAHTRPPNDGETLLQRKSARFLHNVKAVENSLQRNRACLPLTEAKDDAVVTNVEFGDVVPHLCYLSFVVRGNITTTFPFYYPLGGLAAAGLEAHGLLFDAALCAQRAWRPVDHIRGCACASLDRSARIVCCCDATLAAQLQHMMFTAMRAENDVG